MSSRHNRFLNLESARGDKARPEGQAPLRDGGRFESVAGPGEARAAPSVPEAHVERFKLQGEKPLALDEKPAPGQRFPYCARCESANGRFSTACIICGADLTTPEQRAYTERYWEVREQAERQALADGAAFARQRQDAEAERKREQEQYADELLAQLKQHHAASDWRHTPSIGIWLLRRIPHPHRWGVLAGALGLPLLLWRFGNDTLRALGGYLLLAIILLLIPRSVWTARHRRWWW
jgi:hypothetical protein